jgi:hypothetical protein
MNFNQEKTDADLKEMKTGHKEMMAQMRAWRKEMKICLQKTEVCLESKEPTPEDMTNAAAHSEVPNRRAAVETIRALKGQYGDRHLAVRRQ